MATNTGHIDFNEGAAPATPAASKVRLYAKADGLLYSKDDAGTETAVTGGGGGGGTPTFVGAKAYNSATQGSIAATTMTKVVLNTEEFDTSAFHDNVTNNTRMTVPSTGYYLITGYIYGGTTASRIILANFFKNNTTVIRGQVRYDATGNSVAINLTAVASLTAADYIEMRVWCSSSDLTLGDATNIEQQPWMSVTLLGA